MTMLFVAIVVFLVYSDIEMNKKVEAQRFLGLLIFFSREKYHAYNEDKQTNYLILQKG